MRNLRVVLGLGLAFAAGCAGAQAAPFIVPPAHAANVQRWHYMCFREHEISQVHVKLNEAGREGWELAGVASSQSGYSWCLKRPVP